MLFRLTEKPSVADQFLRQLRDKTIQKDTMRFRQNLRRIGQILAYEISKSFDYQSITIETPLASFRTKTPHQLPILIPVMRAGLPFFEGFLDIFDASDSAFVGAYRGKTDANQAFEIEMNYLTSPDLTDQIIIIIDPMIATGKSILKTYQAVNQFGMPKKCYIAGVIGARQGIELVQRKLPHASIWIGDIDPELNTKSYIVPGLGDAGDLAFGQKL